MEDRPAIPYFSDEELASQEIPTSQIADLIETLIRDRADGKIWSAPKASVSLPDQRYAMSTLAVADAPPYLAIKSLLLNPANPSAGEPLMNSVIMLQDSGTGRPVALLDGNWITAERTTALSLIAARRMANPSSRVIALIGCGVQARSHLRAMAATFPLREVRVLGRGQANIDRLRELTTELGMQFHAADTADEAMRGADLIISSITRANEAKPFIDARAVEPGTFASLVDLGQPWCPSSLKHFDEIIIDDKEQEASMKSPMVAANLVSGDLADLVLERVQSTAAKGTRAFVFRGFALGDFALAALAYERARTVAKT